MDVLAILYLQYVLLMLILYISLVKIEVKVALHFGLQLCYMSINTDHYL